MTYDEKPVRGKGLRGLQIAAGLATLLLAGIIAVLSPTSVQLQEGWITPVLAYELARTEADLAFMAGPEHQGLRNAFAAMQRIDMVFPFAYSALLVTAALGTRTRMGLVAAGLGFVTPLLDLYENRVMAEVSTTLDQGLSITLLLPTLFVATWAKWGAIAVGLVLISMAWTRRGDRLLAAPGLLAGAATGAAFASGVPLVAEAMGASVVLAFVMLFVDGLRRTS
ncbi:MAG: hypothetical protein KTR31_12790 [Myxococcales bacterium]|nr:hypothetical protein [Myxococcales bacterium]